MSDSTPNQYSYERIALPSHSSASCRRKFTCWSITKFDYLKWIIRLTFERMSRDGFIKACVELYLDKDPDFIKVLDKIKEKAQKGKNKSELNRRLKRILNKEYKIAQLIGLTHEEISEINNNISKYLPSEITDFSKG